MRRRILADWLGFLKLLISLLHILQIEDFQGASAFRLAADELINLPEAAGIHQTHLRKEDRKYFHRLVEGN